MVVDGIYIFMVCLVTISVPHTTYDRIWDD
jgi:hypothetical protein